MFAVALLAEGVDRNNNYLGTEGVELMSPSSRRAWIEIVFCAEGRFPPASPSSRRAWIEIAASAA